jgi:hypothetical protein
MIFKRKLRNPSLTLPTLPTLPMSRSAIGNCGLGDDLLLDMTTSAFIFLVFMVMLRLVKIL